MSHNGTITRDQARYPISRGKNDHSIFLRRIYVSLSIPLFCIPLMISCEDSSSSAQAETTDLGVLQDADSLNGGSDAHTLDMEPLAGVNSGGITAGTSAGEQSGEEQSGVEVTSGSEAGMPISVAGEEVRMPSCLLSCAEFVECTIKQCPGYGPEDDALLMEECLGLCTPHLARLFDQLTGCPEKIRFASTVRTDFLEFCDSATEGFCETYIATCGEWLGTADCDEQYNRSPRSGSEYTTGAHQQCYEYHLGSAQRALNEGDEARVRESCERAAGLNTCVDE